MPVSPLRVILALTVWFASMGVALTAYWYHWLHAAHHIPQEQRTFEVFDGDSLVSVARRLQTAGVIRWPNLWRQYAKYFDSDPIQVGEYRLNDSESPVSLLNKLQSGEVVTYRVTLIEGRSYQEFLATLHNQVKLEHRLAGLVVEEQLRRLDLPIDHPEGWFYPDTYQYVKGDSDVTVLRRAYARMSSVLREEWLTRADNLPYETPYEALIMASIIEKETGVARERGEIAGVFVRRLLKGMRLQTDPTVIYGLGSEFDGNLTRNHLITGTPYNTYTNRGLPPTPIAMPSEEAVRAALHPEPGETLFFVAKGDGTHHFSATLEEHNKAVERYQRRQRANDYRSAPPPE